MTNVFKIRQGKETHVYRTETPADKKSLLSQFRHVAEELAAKKRKEREGEHERRKSMWNGGGGDVRIFFFCREYVLRRVYLDGVQFRACTADAGLDGRSGEQG